MGEIIALLRATRAIYTIIAILLATYYIDKELRFIDISTILLPVIIQYISFLTNDIFDYKTDLKNKRTDRPLVTGKVTILQAYYILIFLVILALILSFLSKEYVVIYNLAFLTISLAYNKFLKKLPLIGNIIVAFTMVAPILYPYLYYYLEGYKSGVLELYMLSIFLFGISRELVKSLEDVEGDKEEKIYTLPVVFGLEKGKIASITFINLYIAALIFLGININNLIAQIIILGIIVFMVYLITKLAGAIRKEQFREVHEKMRWVMIVGILLLGVI